MNKKRVVAGFLLLESLIYLALSSFFFLVLFQFIVATYGNYKKIQHYNSNISSLYSAADLIIKDLQSASSDINTWQKITDSSIVWKSKSHDIGWFLKNKKLYRVEGQYNLSRDNFSNKIKSLAANNIHSLLFKINNSKQKTCDLITITIEMFILGKLVKVQRSVAINNGLLY